MFNIIVNSSHVVNSNKNMYNYQFKQGAFEIPPDSEAMLTSVQLPYSIYNITTRYMNNKFNLYWPTSTNTYTQYAVDISDGFYTQTAFQKYMESWFIDKKLHLIDGSGNNVYYFSFLANPTAYKNQIILRVVPTTLPAGHTLPVGFPGALPTTARTPYIEILPFTVNHFGKYAGLSPGNYPPGAPPQQTTNYNILSDLNPLTSIVNSLVIKCSLVNNGVSNASDIIDAFAIGSSAGGSVFGSNLNFVNNIEKWVNISEGKFNNIIFTICDQNLNEVVLLDENILISLLIRKKKL